MNELPPGWAWTTLGELCSHPQYGWTTRAAAQGGTKFLRTTDITRGPVAWADVPFCDTEPPEPSKYALKARDIVISRAGSVGASAVIQGDPPDAVFASYLIRFQPSDQVDERFVGYFLRSPNYWEQIADSAAGIALQNVNAPKLRALRMPLAPLPEQKRIVLAIEEAFSLLDAGETALHNSRTRLKRMRDSVLTAAVAGQLVPQDPSETPAGQYLREGGVVSDDTAKHLPLGWTAALIGDLATVGTGSTPSRAASRYWEDGSTAIPWVTSGLLNQGHVVAATEFVTDIALAETSLRLWPPGTLLMAMYGEGKTRGRCSELIIEATCNQACAAISLHEQFESLREYLHLFLDANYLATRRLAAGGVQPNLNLGLVRAIQVPIPPPEEQTRIVAEVERLFSFIEAAERAVAAGLSRSKALRRSVLKAAFEGQLVPQDPTDEPATILLERIAAKRAAH